MRPKSPNGERGENLTIRLPMMDRWKLQEYADRQAWTLNYLIRRAAMEWLLYHTAGAAPRPSTTIVRGL